MKKYVYLFDEGNKDLRNLLGGKGANLAEMTNMGLPVPYGLTVTTEACNLYFSYDTSTNQLGVLFNYGIYDESGVTTTEIFGYYDEENYPVFDYFSK